MVIEEYVDNWLMSDDQHCWMHFIYLYMWWIGYMFARLSFVVICIYFYAFPYWLSN